MNQEEPEEEKKSPIIYILVFFLVLIIVLMIIPFYGIKSDPSPGYIPTLEEVLPVKDQIVYKKLDSIEEIKKLQVSPFIRNTAVKIVTLSCKEESEICYSKAFYYFVRNLNYVPDPERQYIQSPEETLIGGGGDCEDVTLALAQLFKAINIKTRIVLTYNHAFLQVYLPKALSIYKIDKDWISLDPTSNLDFGEINPKYYGEIQNFIYI